MDLNSMSTNENMARLFWQVSVNFTTKKLVLWPTTVFFSVKALKKVLTLFKSALKEKYLLSFCKTLQVSWLERSMSTKVLPSMVLKWSTLFQQQAFLKSHVSSELHTEQVIMVCVEEPMGQECCTCGQVPKSQSWEASRQQVYWLKWRRPNLRRKVSNCPSKKSRGWGRQLWILMRKSQAVTFQQQDFGTTA